jgi:hypothetical protein
VQGLMSCLTGEVYRLNTLLNYTQLLFWQDNRIQID